jgi:RNA polymerase sigma-70 factor (ECF subfamily)
LHSIDDQELMARVQRGDLKAFEALHARYARALLNFFFQMCFDRTASEDYVQETFLRVWRARERWRPVGRFSTWLFQIAKNYWLNEREKQKLRPFHAASEEPGEPVARGAESSPSRAASGNEIAAAIRDAVSALSEKLRLVFVMARYQGLAYAEIAEILEIPEGTVKSRMSLAERTLRDALRDHWE